MKYMIAIAIILSTACETESPNHQSGPVCYRTWSQETCKSCGNSGGYSCTSCETNTMCGVCSDQEGSGCWVTNVLVKCKSECPSGSFLNGAKVP